MQAKNAGLPVKEIIFSLIMILLLLAICEITVRVAVKQTEKPIRPAAWTIIPDHIWMEYHPLLGWFHQKQKTVMLEKKSIRTEINTNSLGLRGKKEYSLKSSKKRWYIFGDSFTFGWGVADNETFASQIEQLDPNQETFNLGVAGYGIDQIYLMSKEFHWDYQPEIALICIFPENFWRATRTFNDAGNGKPYFTVSHDRNIKLHNVPVPEKPEDLTMAQFPSIIESVGIRKILSHSAVYNLVMKAFTKALKLMGKSDPDSSDEWILGRAILSEMIQEIRKHGATPYLVMIPPERWITGTDEPVRQSLARFADNENIPFIDVTDQLKEELNKSSITEWYIPEDGHWTVKAHAWMAKKLLEEIGEN